MTNGLVLVGAQVDGIAQAARHLEEEFVEDDCLLGLGEGQEGDKECNAADEGDCILLV